ncbi:MAG TPA: hypothetical protein VGM90_39630 [Kofleriaceae bacterium]
MACVSVVVAGCTLEHDGGSGAGSGSAVGSGSSEMPSDCEETAPSLGDCGGPPSTTCDPGDSWHWACCYKDHGQWQTTFWECFNDEGPDGGVYPDAYIPDTL